ncbi:MAG: transglutaminase TgpA family protein, partial [Thermodesulfobacteriota bacterium]
MVKDPDKYLPHIIAALIVSILPHVARLPAWIVLWCALLWGYELALLRFQRPRPGRWVRLLLAFLGVAGLLATYAARLGPNAFVGLLAVMAALKPFEVSTHRDRMVTLFLAYFIVITSLFQSETLAVTLYMFVSVFVTTGVLIRINDPNGALSADLKHSGIIMAQALPLMLILFFLFPRIQGSLVGIAPAPQARSGFSDRLSPGSISRLVQSDEVAFRAEFESPRPKQSRLYWRSIVFHRFDGRTWRRLQEVPNIDYMPKGSRPVAYTIALEPHDQRWLFALDRPADKPRWSRMYADFTIRRHRPVKRKKYYDMTAFPEGAKAARWGVEQGLQLPSDGNPKARQLAAEFARDKAGASVIIDRAKNWLREKDFRYTLRPPALGQNPIDAFLFNSRKGYCEHYASAFAFLMRAAGVPARIVGGYQGGEMNPYGDYLIIRQSDAHAWVEVWLEKKGWIRMDPTAFVAPERLTQGASAALPEGEWPGVGSGVFRGWLRMLDYRWDAISTQWEAWFTGYSHLEQKALLERLGISLKSWKGPFMAGLLLFGSVFLIIGAYLFVQLKPAAGEKDRVGRCYRRFCRKLAKAGLSRKPEEGPMDFAARIRSERPELASEAEAILHLYVRLRYQG